MTTKNRMKILERMALTLAEHPEEERETRKINITQEFGQALTEDYATENDRLGINITGQTRRGKSTLAIALGAQFHQKCIEHRKQKQQPFGIRNIFRNQTEAKWAFMNLDHNTIIVDEIRQSESIGRNITAEEAQINDFFYVNAAKMLHTLCIAPNDHLDPTADIEIQVIHSWQHTLITHCHVRYRLQRGLDIDWILLGYIEISVKKLIRNWIEVVRPTWNKINKTKKEWEWIRKQATQDYYVEYIIRKQRQIDIHKENTQTKNTNSTKKTSPKKETTSSHSYSTKYSHYPYSTET